MTSAAKFVLIAEDDVNMQVLLRDYFMAKGYDVQLAGDGLQALEQIALRQPNLLILDMMMPELNGWDVAERLRKDPATLDLPILALTAHALVGQEARALASGCNAFLSKPFTFPALKAAVEKLLLA